MEFLHPLPLGALACVAPAALFDPHRAATGGFCGDLPSEALLHAKPGWLWLTVLNNYNLLAPAAAVGVAGLVLCGGATPKEALLRRANEMKINLFTTPLSEFACAVELWRQSGEKTNIF